MPTMKTPMIDLKDAVSPDNPPIGIDRAAWKEYIGAIEKKREEQVRLMQQQLSKLARQRLCGVRRRRRRRQLLT